MARLGEEGEGSVGQPGALGHGDNAESAGAVRVGGIEAAAVVGDGHDEGVPLEFDRDFGAGCARVLRNVAECFLRDAVENERSVSFQYRFADRGQACGGVEAGHALGVLGELCEGREEASLVDDGGVEAVSDPAEHGAQVFEFLADGVGLGLGVCGRVVVEELADVVGEQGDALEGVVVDFAGHVGAFFFVGGDEFFGVLAVEGEEPALVDDERDAERYDDDGDGEDGADVNEEDVVSNGHRMPFQTMRKARVSTAAFTT